MGREHVRPAGLQLDARRADSGSQVLLNSLPHSISVQFTETISLDNDSIIMHRLALYNA